MTSHPTDLRIPNPRQFERDIAELRDSFITLRPYMHEAAQPHMPAQVNLPIERQSGRSQVLHYVWNALVVLETQRDHPTDAGVARLNSFYRPGIETACRIARQEITDPQVRELIDRVEMQTHSICQQMAAWQPLVQGDATARLATEHRNLPLSK